jgi:hypothetical protein
VGGEKQELKAFLPLCTRPSGPQGAGGMREWEFRSGAADATTPPLSQALPPVPFLQLSLILFGFF